MNKEYEKYLMIDDHQSMIKVNRIVFFIGGCLCGIALSVLTWIWLHSPVF